jgi:hypothetical protein
VIELRDEFHGRADLGVVKQRSRDQSPSITSTLKLAHASGGTCPQRRGQCRAASKVKSSLVARMTAGKSHRRGRCHPDSMTNPPRNDYTLHMRFNAPASSASTWHFSPSSRPRPNKTFPNSTANSSLRGKSALPYAAPDLPQADIALYFSAGWCGPCHQFTPELVKFYNEMKQIPGFEVVHESRSGPERDGKIHGRNGDALAGTPLQRGEKRPRVDQGAGSGIPDLVLLKRRSPL